MSGASPALIWSPFADEDQAVRAANQLLDEGLIACANILPVMRSLYVWDGERGDERECGVLFKTNTALLARAIERLEAIHPYDTPAVLGWPAARWGEAAGAWLGSLSGEEIGPDK